MHRGRLLTLFLVLIGFSVLPTTSAEASCVAPSLTRPAGSVSLTAPLQVSGEPFIEGCDDTGGSTEGLGCLPDREHERETQRPLQDVELRLRQDGREWTLGVADARGESDPRFGQKEWGVELPEDVVPGQAFLETDYTEPHPIVIEE